MRGETSRLRTKLWGPKRESGSANGEDRYHVMVFPVDRSPAKASENVITDVDGYLLEMFFQNGCRMCRIQSRQGVEIHHHSICRIRNIPLQLGWNRLLGQRISQEPKGTVYLTESVAGSKKFTEKEMGIDFEVGACDSGSQARPFIDLTGGLSSHSGRGGGRKSPDDWVGRTRFI